MSEASKLVCYGHGDEPGAEMTLDASGFYVCTVCGFQVRLQVEIAPDWWYEQLDHYPRRPLSTEEPNQPYCVDCHRQMRGISCPRSPITATKSLFFFCMVGEKIAHRLEAYFKKLTPEELAAFLDQSPIAAMIRDGLN